MMRAMRSHHFVLPACLCAFMFLTSCGKPSLAPLPEGVQSLTGRLEHADLSLTRRGTHLLYIAEKPAYFVESSAVNLRTLEGKTVVLQGTFSYNTTAHDLPLFTVQHVLKGGQETLRQWNVSSMGITLQVPRSWSAVIQPGSAVFTESGAVSPILRIGKETSASLVFDFETFTSPSSSLVLRPLVIGDKRAVGALDTAKNIWNVHIDLGRVTPNRIVKNVLTLSFALEPNTNAEAQVTSNLRIIQTVKFTAEMNSATSAASAGTGSTLGLGSACGGPAGILCPKGFYCQLADTQTDSGRCQKF